MANNIRRPIEHDDGTDVVSTGDQERLLDRNPAFCMAPWMHLHIQTEGDVTPCCENLQPLGNINRQSFGDIWNGAPMAAVRARMLRGERDESCRKCYDKEDAGVASLRRRFREKRAHLFDTVVASRADGAAPNARPVFWDIRYSNVCNFRCRSCWHGSSSRWFADGAALGVSAGEEAVLQGVEDADRLLDELDSFLPDLEEIYFAGGEPLIMDEHYRLLDHLIARGRTDVILSYNTNLSVTGFRGRDVLDLWNRFPDVTVAASIDATGARGELLRKEQNWRETVQNARRLRARCPHVDFRVETTASILNVLHLPDMFRELIALDFAPARRMAVHVLQGPPYYNIRVLPPAWKDRARAGFTELEHWFATQAPSMPDRDTVLAFHRQQIGEIVAYMDSEDWSGLLPQFREMTARLDKLRGEATHEVFPELAPLLAPVVTRRAPASFGWRTLGTRLLRT